MSRTRLAVNWFNYPICLWQAWFQPNCSSCGRRWQTAMWRRRTARPITVTGVWTCHPPPLFPPKTTTSMDPPMASTSATRSRERGKTAQTLSYCWRKVPLYCWSLTEKSKHSLRHCWNLEETRVRLFLFSCIEFSASLRRHCPCWRRKSLQGKPNWWTGTHRAFPACEY